MNIFSEEEREAGWKAVESYESKATSLIAQLKSAFQNPYPIESKETVIGGARAAIAELLTLTTQSMEDIAKMVSSKDVYQENHSEIVLSELLERKDLSALGILLLSYSFQLEPNDEDTLLKGLFLITPNLDIRLIMGGDYYHKHIDDRIEGAFDVLDSLGVKYRKVIADGSTPLELCMKLEEQLINNQ